MMNPAFDQTRISDRIEHWLARINYSNPKRALYYSRGTGSVEVRCWVPNSYAPDDEVLVVHNFPIPYFTAITEDFDEFVAWVRTCCKQTELHEVDEWLLVDGERKWDPHAPLDFIGKYVEVDN